MLRVIALTLLLPATAQAQSFVDCDHFAANARNLTQPYADATRTYANGAISLLSLDTGGEPACCSSYVMVLAPDPEQPFQICQLLTQDGDSGYSGVDLTGVRSSYDAATGLTLRVPVGIYNGAGSDPETVAITINQQTGVIRAQ